MALSVPESVNAYITDQTLRGAIDVLLTRPASYFDTSLSVEEQRSYRRAWLAAQQVRVEYANFLQDLWTILWPECEIGVLPATSASAGKLEKNGYPSSSIEAIWKYGGFTRTLWLIKKRAYLSLTIYLYTHENHFRFLLASEAYNEVGEESLLNAGIMNKNGWHVEDDELLSKSGGFPYSDVVQNQKLYDTPLSILKNSARELLDLVITSL